MKQEALYSPAHSPCKRQRRSIHKHDNKLQDLLADVLKNAYLDKNNSSNAAILQEPPHFGQESHVNYTDYSDNHMQECMIADDNMDEDDGILAFDASSEEEEEAEPVVNMELLRSFEEYVADCQKNRWELSPNIQAGVSLFRVLSEKRVPLNVYDAIFQWHTENLEATKFVTRDTLLSTLSKRYNMDRCKPYTRKLELPHSKVHIDLVCHDMGSQIQSLLTDPRISDEDYLFFDNNPFEPPPKEFRVIGDINTGQCYRKTYEKLIKDPTKEVLLPIIFYMDAANTGSEGNNLPIESLQFTLGIFNAKTRDKIHAWRNIGYVKKFLVEDTHAVDIIMESQHMDIENYLETTVDDTEDSVASSSITGNDDKYHKTNAQDLHVMLDVMLQSYLEIQRSGGIEWKLHYKGKTHHVTFVPFVMFVKGDGQEHDKHCGQYTSKTENVKMLCRYCTCKNEDTGDAYRNDPKKTPAMIQRLVDCRDVEGLKALSQQLLYNAWYNVQFGIHNKLGIHGACPLEVLHWLLSGKLKYSREMFVTQTGSDTNLAKLFNNLAKSIGILFQRQSNRSLPRTNFSWGIQKGKLTAQEMTGLILVLLATIRTRAGTNCLLTNCRGNQKKFFGKVEYIQDWVLLLETQLQWNAWLSLPEISVYDIRRSKTKVREILKMEKRIGKREKGMAFRTMNFHGALHIADDMLNFGVPNNVNTRCNEEHHKQSKTAAKRTQKRAGTFDFQCATQLHNMNVIDVATQEIACGRPVWDYYVTREDEGSTEKTENIGKNTHKLSGVHTSFFFDATNSEYQYTIKSRMGRKDLFKYDDELIEYLAYITQKIGCGVEELDLYTEHSRQGQIFWASPHHLGKPWRDWVMINWGTGTDLPAQIHCFVDLRGISDKSRIEQAIYAVIESADQDLSPTDQVSSELFQPYIKETQIDDEGNIKRKFYMVDVDSFAAPACVIPNMGHDNPAALLCLVPKHEWPDQFSEWLGEEHSRDFTEQD